MNGKAAAHDVNNPDVLRRGKQPEKQSRSYGQSENGKSHDSTRGSGEASNAGHKTIISEQASAGNGDATTRKKYA